jgi:hypothetical protein
MGNTIKTTKYFYPPRPGNGAGTFSDNIVGLQVVDGGGLTQGNFEFTTTITEKVNRNFNVGVFSEPMSLETLNIDSIEESRRIISTQFKVYPNYDVSQVLNFSLYGSLSKRFSVSINKIVNYFPAAIDVNFYNLTLSSGYTAENISYDKVNDETYFEVNVSRLINPFDIDYSVNATNNLSLRETDVSIYRNLFNTYLDYVIVISGQSYPIIGFTPSESLTEGEVSFYVSGSPFGDVSIYDQNYVIRLNDFRSNKVFEEDFDEVEKFLLNRLISPEYTAYFQVPQQTETGEFYTEYKKVTWPKDGQWNLDIRSTRFTNYLNTLQDIAINLDSFKTNLISRFLVTGSLKEFDTLGHKVEKIFQIYGRSFDQIKQFIDALAYMNSVNYNPSNDIPSQLLVNLAQTLGWGANFSPISDEDFLTSVFGGGTVPQYSGYSRDMTPTEVNYAYYRNLIMNAAYLFKSKGTRRSIEFLLRLIGAPESLIEFNEHIYLADQKINVNQFNSQWTRISGGTTQEDVPAFIEGATYRIRGVAYTPYATTSIFNNINLFLNDYPLDSEGYPKKPRETEDFFFQEGSGWYESTPQHRSPEEVVVNRDVFTGQNVDIQTRLTPFTYGQIYLDRFREFPYMSLGFKLQKVVDNKKSWIDTDTKTRSSIDGDYNAYYYVDNEKLVVNVKNVELSLNPSQGLVYEIWDQSRKYGYPIPNSGYSVSNIGYTMNYLPLRNETFTTINPEPNKKTFFEFAQTFWENMINVRSRQVIGGSNLSYPELQSVFWKYLESENNVGIPTNKYTYQKLIDYVNGLGPYWMKLIEQMIPASTIWTTGIKYENAPFQRQKFVYRRQFGCRILPVEKQSCYVISNIFNYTCPSEFAEFFIYPWLNGDINVSNFQSILANRLNYALALSGKSLNDCTQNSVQTNWYINLQVGDDVIFEEQFYDGFGYTDVPSNDFWRETLIDYLDRLNNYGYGYELNGNLLTINGLTCGSENVGKLATLSVGINMNINCECD